MFSHLVTCVYQDVARQLPSRVHLQPSISMEFFHANITRTPPPPEEGPIDLLFRSWSKKTHHFYLQHVRLMLLSSQKWCSSPLFEWHNFAISHISTALWLGTKRTLFEPFSQWMFFCLLWAKCNSANYSITFVLKWIHIPYLLYTYIGSIII